MDGCCWVYASGCVSNTHFFGRSGSICNMLSQKERKQLWRAVTLQTRAEHFSSNVCAGVTQNYPPTSTPSSECDFCVVLIKLTYKIQADSREKIAIRRIVR